MLRVMVVDDERLARQGLRQLLEQHKEVSVVAEAGRVGEAVEKVQECRPDAVFLDIQMPGANGFELIERLEKPPKIVFVTAHSQHAVQAFEVDAVDYLLKPVHPSRLADTVSRLITACGKGEDAPRYTRRDSLCLRAPERTIVAPLESIGALAAEGDFTHFHIIGQPSIMICHSLGSYEKILPFPPFMRLSRSLMVNLDRVSRVEVVTRDEAVLSLQDIPQVFRLGRRALARLKKHLG